MNKKGQNALGIGIILVTFITIIVGVILFQAVAQQAGEGTSLSTVVNETVSTSIDNVTTFYLDYRSIADVIIVNGTVDGEGNVVSGNYTVTNNAIDPSDGTLSVGITPLTTEDWSVFGTTWRISGTAQPQTYIADSAGRSITGLIAIFFALAVAIIALTPTLRSGILNMLGGIGGR